MAGLELIVINPILEHPEIILLLHYAMQEIYESLLTFVHASSITFWTSILYMCHSESITLNHSHLIPFPAVVVIGL